MSFVRLLIEPVENRVANGVFNRVFATSMSKPLGARLGGAASNASTSAAAAAIANPSAGSLAVRYFCEYKLNGAARVAAKAASKPTASAGSGWMNACVRMADRHSSVSVRPFRWSDDAKRCYTTSTVNTAPKASSSSYATKIKKPKPKSKAEIEAERARVEAEKARVEAEKARAEAEKAAEASKAKAQNAEAEYKAHMARNDDIRTRNSTISTVWGIVTGASLGISLFSYFTGKENTDIAREKALAEKQDREIKFLDKRMEDLESTIKHLSGLNSRIKSLDNQLLDLIKSDPDKVALHKKKMAEIHEHTQNQIDKMIRITTDLYASTKDCAYGSSKELLRRLYNEIQRQNSKKDPKNRHYGRCITLVESFERGEDRGWYFNNDKDFEEYERRKRRSCATKCSNPATLSEDDLILSPHIYKP